MPSVQTSKTRIMQKRKALIVNICCLLLIATFLFGMYILTAPTAFSVGAVTGVIIVLMRMIYKYGN